MFRPDNADDKSVTWQSSDSSVATVSATGKVTAVAVGDATITATASGKSDSYSVSVKEREEDWPTEETQNSQSTPEPQIATPTPLPAEVVYTVQIDTTSLPYGAQYAELPGGEIVELNGEDTISVTVSQSDLENGKLELIALDEEQEVLGFVGVDASEGTPFIVFMLLAMGALIAGIGGTLLVIKIIVSKKA